MTTLHVPVELPAGTIEVPVVVEGAGDRGTLVIAHGAGAGKEHPFLIGFADGIRSAGFRTARFDFPYRVQGRRMPGPAPHALATWRAVVAAVRAAGSGEVHACGKSYGGRMASMAAAEGLEVASLTYLGYPLHAPGKPEKPRAEHLPSVTQPQLFVEGTKDAFIQPIAQFDEVVAGCRDARVAWIEGGGHSFEIAGDKRPAEQIGAELAPLVADFLG